jgi:hypothetical protein
LWDCRFCDGITNFVVGLQKSEVSRRSQNSESTWNAKLDQNAILWTRILTPPARLDITPC